MKIWLPALLLTAFFLETATAKEAKNAKPPDWLAKVSPPQPGKFPAPAAREWRYTAGWSGVPAGSVNVTFSRSGDIQTLHATGRTIGLARVFFPLDADCTAICDPATLAPKTTTIVEAFSDETRTTIQQFSHDKVTRVHHSQPPEKDDGKIKTVVLPDVLDLQSSLLYLRSLPLRVGDQITFLTYATGSPYLARVTVEKKENIAIPAGKYAALRLHLDLTGIDKKLKLKNYKKARDITAWLSDDAERTYLKFSADLPVGAVFVELAQP